MIFITRTLLLSLFIGIIIVAKSHCFAQTSFVDASGNEVVYDRFDLLTEDEEKRLETAIKVMRKELKSRIKVVIYDTYDDLTLTSRKEILNRHNLQSFRGSLVLFLIDIEKSKGRLVLSSDYRSVVSDGYITNIESQLISAVLKSDGVEKSVRETAKELLKQKKNSAVISSSVDEDSFSSEFFFVFALLSIAMAIYTTLTGAKLAKVKGKKFENMEFFAISGLFKSQRYFIYFAVWAGLTVIFFFTIFYYSEVFMLSLASIFATIPIAMGVMFIVSYVRSSSIDVDKSLKSITLSIQEKKLLLDPKVSGFDLVKITFAELVISGKLIIEREDQEMRDGRIRSAYIVLRGHNFDGINASNYVYKPFIQAFADLGIDKGYYLKYFAGHLSEEIPGLKWYKKSATAATLVRKGLMNKKFWRLNMFKPTPVSAKIVVDIKQELDQLKNQLTTFNADESNETPLSTDYLLLDNYETILDDISEHSSSSFIFNSVDAIRIFDYYFEKARIKQIDNDESFTNDY